MHSIPSGKNRKNKNWCKENEKKWKYSLLLNVYLFFSSLGGKRVKISTGKKEKSWCLLFTFSLSEKENQYYVV